MEFKIEQGENAVELKFRKGIYFGGEIDKAIESFGKGLKASKREEDDFFIIKLKPSGKTDLEEIAWRFCNLVIASGKEGI